MMIECDIMKNIKGQALVEFIIVLPLMILILIAIIDFGNIFTKKYMLQNDLDIILSMYETNEYAEIEKYTNTKNIDIKYELNGKYLTISLNKKIDIMSPFLNIALGKNYDVTVNKTIYRGSNE